MLTPSGVTRLLDGLERDGWVTKGNCEQRRPGHLRGADRGGPRAARVGGPVARRPGARDVRGAALAPRSSRRSSSCSAACPAAQPAAARPVSVRLAASARARTSASIASRSPSTGRSTASAFSIRRPSSDAATSSGVKRTRGSFGPPEPCSRLSQWWPTTSSVPPGATAAAARREHRGELLRRQLEIEHRRRGRTPRRAARHSAQVGLDPLDLDAALRREPRAWSSATSEKSTPVDRQPRCGEPDGVPAGAAGEVERAARREASDLGDEKAVRLGPEQQPALAVLAVPVLALHPCYSRAE